MIVSLEQMKEYLGLEDTDFDDFLTEQLTLIQSTIEAYCRRSFEEKTYVQTFYSDDHSYSKNLTLFHFPVTELQDGDVKEDGESLDEEAYRIHKPTGKIIRTDGNAFFYGVDSVEVTYKAGYASADMPPVVISAIKSLVQERYNKKKSGVDLNFGSDVQRISIPGAMSIDFDYSLQNNDRSSTFGLILGNYVNTLDFYRSERAIIGAGKISYVE